MTQTPSLDAWNRQKEMIKKIRDDNAITILIQFLELHRRKPGETITHTLLEMYPTAGNKINGSYHIPDDKRNEFYKIFSDAVATGRSIPITEQPADIAPLRVDIDLRLTEPVDVITDEYVDVLIKHICQDGLCYVLTKPPREERKGDNVVIKHGVHLHFPDLLVNRGAAMQLRDKVIRDMNTSLYTDSRYVIETDLTDVYDKASYMNNWFLYGARKTTEEHAWKITRVVNGEMPENPVAKLSVLRAPWWVIEDAILKDTPVKDILPPSTLKAEGKTSEDLRTLVGMLSPSRAGPYQKWRDVCFAVFNIAEKIELGYDFARDILREFSLKNPAAYDEGSFATEIAKLAKPSSREKKYGWTFLKDAAREDNPEAYAAAMCSLSVSETLYTETAGPVEITLQDMLSCDKVKGVVRLVSRMAQGRIKATNKGGGSYEFYFHDGFRWVYDNDIKTTRIHKFIDMIETAVSKVIDNFVVSPLSDDTAEKTLKMLERVSDKLNNYTFPKTCAEACLNEFLDCNFRSRLDKYHCELFAHSNGVYNYDTGEFRMGHPDDYISITSGYNYTPEYNEEIQDDIRKTYQGFFETHAEYKYFVQTVSLWFHGNRKRTNNNFIWFHGPTGSNGKSTIPLLLRRVFGGYYKPLSVTVYTNKSFGEDANAPCPALSRMAGIRLAGLSEIQDGSTFYSGMFKTLTSGLDPITPRDLHQGGGDAIEYIPQFGQIAFSNALPKFRAAETDGGVRRRLSTIRLGFEFVLNPTEPHQKKIDINLTKRFETEEYDQQQWLFFLREYEQVKHLDGIEKPEEIVAMNKELLDEHNPLAHFLEESVERVDMVDGKKPFVLAKALFDAFKGSEHFTGKYNPTQSQFKTDMAARGFIQTMNTRSGKGHNLMIYDGIVIKDQEGREM